MEWSAEMEGASAFRALEREAYVGFAYARRANVPDWEPHLIAASFGGWNAVRKSPEVVTFSDFPATFMGLPVVLDGDIGEPWILMDAAEADAYLARAWTRGICARSLRDAVTGKYRGKFRRRPSSAQGS